MMHVQIKSWGFMLLMTAGLLGGCTTDQINMATQAVGMVTAAQGGTTTMPTTGAMEYNTDRYGSDFRSFEIQANPAACQAACVQNSQCRAWTYVKPGVQANNAMCHLKNPIPATSPCDFCVSGVVR